MLISAAKSPYLPFLNLVANYLSPLLDDVDQSVALIQELTLLAGCIHLCGEATVRHFQAVL